jgi:hypothetical protein
MGLGKEANDTVREWLRVVLSETTKTQTEVAKSIGYKGGTNMSRVLDGAQGFSYDKAFRIGLLAKKSEAEIRAAIGEDDGSSDDDDVGVVAPSRALEIALQTTDASKEAKALARTRQAFPDAPANVPAWLDWLEAIDAVNRIATVLAQREAPGSPVPTHNANADADDVEPASERVEKETFSERKLQAATNSSSLQDGSDENRNRKRKK